MKYKKPEGPMVPLHPADPELILLVRKALQQAQNNTLTGENIGVLASNLIEALLEKGIYICLEGPQ